jgi:hypothetical protein
VPGGRVGTGRDGGQFAVPGSWDGVEPVARAVWDGWAHDHDIRGTGRAFGDRVISSRSPPARSRGSGQAPAGPTATSAAEARVRHRSAADCCFGRIGTRDARIGLADGSLSVTAGRRRFARRSRFLGLPRAHSRVRRRARAVRCPVAKRGAGILPCRIRSPPDRQPIR